MTRLFQNRKVFAWALYDWANSAFATTVMAGFFPVFFKLYWAKNLQPTASSFWFGFASTAASAIALMMAPLLGALAMRQGKLKPLKTITIIGSLATTALFFVPALAWPLALLVFVVACVCFSNGYVFYDALLMDVATSEQRHRVSALGFALGYLGGGLLFALNIVMVSKPQLFGIADAATAVRYSLLSAGLWWGIFAVPIFISLHETKPQLRASAGDLFRKALATFQEIRGQRRLLFFLLAYWLYIDGVDTIMRMAIDYGLAIGLQSQDLTKALLLTQFIGLPATLLFGYIGHRYGAFQTICVGLAIYLFVGFWAYFIQTAGEFYFLAIVVGLVQGGVQSLSRSYFTQLLPPGDHSDYFGFYNMFGKFAAVLGPLLMGLTAYMTDNSRAASFVVIGLFTGGITLFIFSRAGSAAPTTR